MRPYLLLSLAILVFGIAQFMPALVPDMEAWNGPDKPAVPGYLVTAVAWPYYLSNIALLLGPLFVYLFRRLKKSRRYFQILVVIYLLTPVSAFAFREFIIDVAIGFYFWIASYCIASLGAALALIQKQPSEGGSCDAEEAV